jgi:hypothetical protein
VLKGKRDKGIFSPGGIFSLGRMAKGVATSLGFWWSLGWGLESLRLILREVIRGGRVGEDSGNGLAGSWVLGEPIFSDVQLDFDIRSVPSVRR